jgi:hypothetical protein
MAQVIIAEEVASSTGLLAWLARGIGLAAPLAELIFGRGHSEPARNNSIGPYASLLRAPAVIMHDMFGQLIHALQAIYNTIHANRLHAHDETVRVLHAAQHAYNLTNARITLVKAQLTHYAQHLYNVANANAALKVAREATKRAQGDATVLAAAQHGVNLANANTARKVAAEAHTRAQGDAAVLGAAQHLYNVGKVYADTVSTRAAARSSAKLSADAADATHADYSPARADLAAAAAVGGTELAGIAALISRVPTAAPQTMPAAESAETAINRVMAKALRDCVAPNCRNLGKFGRDLSGLGGLLGGAAFLAFIAWAAEHPEQAARDTEAVAGPLVRDTVAAVRAVVGI